ncbi:MAG: cell division protein FtsQ [Frankiaceae bacterium]|jgi:cell division protein FtsQ|nr:cell division protein FtsQ [Frankiaceae bacterium]
MSVVTDARPKLAERTARRRYRMLRRLLPVVGVLAALGFAAWVVLVSTWLGVHDVQVAGEGRVSAAQVVAAAAVPDGAPLARLDTAGIAARVSKLAPVATVRVTRQWPRAIRITVTERVPFAVVSINGTPWLVDRSAIPFDKAGAAQSTLPHITTAHAGADDEATKAGLDVLAALPADVLSRVNRIDVPGPEEVTLALTGGKTVVWGSARDSAKKAAVLDAVLKQPGKVYDVSTPDVVTVR